MSFSNSKMKLCREKLVFKEEVILGIHSNVAGDGYGYTDGHAWVSVSTSTERVYLGLWPDGHPRVVNTREECTDVRINMETGARPKVSRYYFLNMTQVGKLNQFINKPDVWKYTHNCSSWATRLIKDVLGVSISAIDYAIFSTPRELGKELLELEKKKPTGYKTPVRNVQAEQSSLGGSF